MGAVVAVIVWYTDVASSNLDQGEVYNIMIQVIVREIIKVIIYQVSDKRFDFFFNLFWMKFFTVFVHLHLNADL
jgi:hypothetical protein